MGELYVIAHYADVHPSQIKLREDIVKRIDVSEKIDYWNNGAKEMDKSEVVLQQEMLQKIQPEVNFVEHPA